MVKRVGANPEKRADSRQRLVARELNSETNRDYPNNLKIYKLLAFSSVKINNINYICSLTNPLFCDKVWTITINSARLKITT